MVWSAADRRCRGSSGAVFRGASTMTTNDHSEQTAGLLSPAGRIAAAGLAILLLIAIAATVYLILVPAEAEPFTEFYLLNEDGVAAAYPTRMTVGVQELVFVGVTNHEGGNTRYTVEVFLLNQTGNALIGKTVPVDSFTITVPDGETLEQPVRITPKDPSRNRFEFLLFKGDAPGPEIQNFDRTDASYRDLYLWVEIAP
jgi:uncharacterized membrane protein